MRILVEDPIGIVFFDDAGREHILLHPPVVDAIMWDEVVGMRRVRQIEGGGAGRNNPPAVVRFFRQNIIGPQHHEPAGPDLPQRLNARRHFGVRPLFHLAGQGLDEGQMDGLAHQQLQQQADQAGDDDPMEVD